MTPKEKLSEIVKSAFAFTARERRGILWFIPLAILLSLLVARLGKPRFDAGLRVAADLAEEAPQEGRPVRAEYAPAFETEESAAPERFRFDPNTVTYRQLRALGFTSRAAAGIIKFRESGKVFRIKEDFAACWDVGDSVFYALEPYIVISSEFAVKKRDGGVDYSTADTRRDTLFTFDPNTLDAAGLRALGFSSRQAEAIIERREQIGGFRSAGEFAECYVISPSMFERLQPYINIVPAVKKAPGKVELNTADSTALEALHGIGALTAGRIVALRTRLGGFANATQLSQVQGMTEVNYERILQQITVDSTKIQKIDINFAAPEAMAAHPYITPEVLRKVIKNRQLKGGWVSTDDMIKDGTLTGRQAALLRPYIKFTPLTN